MNKELLQAYRVVSSNLSFGVIQAAKAGDAQAFRIAMHSTLQKRKGKILLGVFMGLLVARTAANAFADYSESSSAGDLVFGIIGLILSVLAPMAFWYEYHKFAKHVIPLDKYLMSDNGGEKLEVLVAENAA